MLGSMSDILCGEITKRFALAWRHFSRVNLTSKENPNHIFIDRAGLSRAGQIQTHRLEWS